MHHETKTMKANIFILLFFLSTISFSQTIISGKVCTKKGTPLIGASVSLKNTFLGTSADINGKFILKTNLRGEQTIVVHFIGYKTIEQKIILSKREMKLNFVLKEKLNNLNTVYITAGVFEASDKKKGVALKPLDILTTASAAGDIYGALRTLPGVETVGEDGRLFVRGGESYETKNFIDGMLVQNSNAYSSRMPDLPARGRFSPTLFKGVSFNSGAYSAEYGQALSSALILKTEGLAPRTQTNLSLLTVGAGISHTLRLKNTSLALSGNYTNLKPYFSLVKQNIEWKNFPVSYTGTTIFRQKVRKDGLIKFFGSIENDTKSILYHSIDFADSSKLIKLRNNNLYLNTTYNDSYAKWLLMSGISYSYNYDNIDLGKDNVKNKEKTLQSKIVLSRQIFDYLKIKLGTELTNKQYSQNYFRNKLQDTFSSSFIDNNSAFFVETSLRAANLFSLRIGSRFEYSSLLKKHNIAPRISIALKTSLKSQISLSGGVFYQTPQNDYLRFTHNLNFEKAYHYVVNYQITTKYRIFRIEAYYKDYLNLVKYKTANSPVADTYNNNGFGYARGIDIFYRDKKTLKYGDFWISYSFLDTKRDFKNYPQLAVPTFVSKHNLSVVYKYFISKLSTQVSFTYSFSSGRTYLNPNTVDFLGDKTKPYQDLSFSASYLTKIANCSTIVHFSVSNIPGFNNVFGYRFATVQNHDGIYNSQAITPSSKRFILLGIFISI